MAKTVRKKNIRPVKKTAVSPFNIYWDKKNYLFLFLGFILLFAGYYFMSINPWNSFPALNISPVILIIAYIVIFPASILFREKKNSGNSETNEIATNKEKEKA